MSRAILLFLFMSLAVSLAAPSFTPRAGDPGIDGKDYLLSEVDFRAVLVVARAHLARLHPQPSIYRVTVLSTTEVEAWYGDQGAVDAESLILKRGDKGWQVTGYGGIKRS
jgi:hypothetical protein